MEELNKQLPSATSKLGYLDISCRVQRTEKRPRPQNFENMKFPALLVRIGYAKRGSAQERLLAKSNASSVIDLEITFRDQVYQFQELCLIDAAVAVQAFSLNEIVAEKLRALLQQKKEHRDRYRRQDVYDIAYLLENYSFDDAARNEVLDIFTQKCASREIFPTRSSLTDPEVVERARTDWNSIELEVTELPEFDAQFEKVARFYTELPWGAQGKIAEGIVAK